MTPTERKNLLDFPCIGYDSGECWGSEKKVVRGVPMCSVHALRHRRGKYNPVDLTQRAATLAQWVAE